MPDKRHKDNNDSGMEAVIGNNRLEELRKKYAAVDDDGFDNSVSSPEENDLAQQDTPVLGDKNIEASGEQALSELPGETETQDISSYESEASSLESLEKVMSTFRTVYQEGDKQTTLSPGQAIGTPPSVLDISAIPEQNEVENPPQKKETARDYLAGMRIVYEEPEESFSSEPKEAATVMDRLAFPAETTQQDVPAEALFETAKSTNGLADLFQQAENQSSVKETTFKRFTKSIFPHKGDSIGEILRKIVLNIAVLTMLVCGGILLNIYAVAPYLNSREADKTIQIKTNSNTFAGWSTAKEKYPGTNFPTGMQLKFAELFATNKDFAGWLDIPGIGIDLPVVKGKNNTEYLTKSFYGEKSKYGCCFIDSSNGIAQLDRNTVIYGHNMKSDNLMLGPLESYKTIDGFKAAPSISLSTLYDDTKWKIYAVFISNGSGSGDNGYLFNYIFRNLSSDDAFSSYIRQIDQRKLYTTGVDILPGDKILTVSTCVYDFKDARLAVVARMVREGESEEVDVSKVALQKNPRYPQAWYTAKGKTNPYKNAEQWFPK